MKKIDSNLSSLEKFEAWFGKNAIKVVILCIAAVLLSMIIVFKVTSSAENDRKKILYLLNKATDYTVVVTPDGRVAKIEKKKINAGILRRHIRNIVMKYFILDSNTFLDKNGSAIKVDPKKTGEFLSTLNEKNPQIKNLSYFFDAKDKGSALYFYSYLKYLYGLFSAGSLPDIIKTTGYVKEESFESKDNRFMYNVVVPVKVSYVGIDQKWHVAEGNISYTIEGYIDPFKSSDVNPLGIKVLKVSFSYISV